jgi:hypothetical protein
MRKQACFVIAIDTFSVQIWWWQMRAVTVRIVHRSLEEDYLLHKHDIESSGGPCWLTCSYLPSRHAP